MTNLMQSVWAWMQARYQAEDGATAIEYGLIASLISVVIIAAVTLVGTKLDAVFDFIAGALKTG